MPGPAQQNRFKVTIDGLPLGDFSKCEGLKASYEMKSYREGGQNHYVHQLPGRVNYENITLTRPITEASRAVGAFFAAFQVAVRRCNAQISVMDSAGSEVMSWALGGVVPVSWSASSADAGAAGVITETLVLSHTGFLDIGGAGGLL